jgi:hypothetical protein
MNGYSFLAGEGCGDVVGNRYHRGGEVWSEKGYRLFEFYEVYFLQLSYMVSLSIQLVRHILY